MLASMSLFVSAVAFCLSARGIWDERHEMKKLAWSELLRNDVHQLQAIIMLMNLTAVAFFISGLLLFFTPYDQYTLDYCGSLNAAGCYLYGIFYQFFYMFMFKKSLIITRTEKRLSIMSRIAMLVALFGATCFMLIWVIMSDVWFYPGLIDGWCYELLSDPVVYLYYLVIIFALAASLLYLFIGPLLRQAHNISSANEARAVKLKNVAYNNVVLTAISLSAQAAAGITFVIVSEDPSLPMYTAQIANMFSFLEVSVSAVCAMMMTNIWMPRTLRHRFQDMNASEHSPSSEIASLLQVSPSSPSGHLSALSSVRSSKRMTGKLAD